MDDLISRQAAIDLIESIETERLKGNIELIYAPAIKGLRALPSAQPEIKQQAINSSDCIDRQAAIDALDKIEAEVADGYGYQYAKWREYFVEMPSAQPDIIRCKDCKHWMPYEWMFSEVWQSQNIDDYPEDEISCNYCDVHMKSNDFCSRAERREETT